jgi:protein TonB
MVDLAAYPFAPAGLIPPADSAIVARRAEYLPLPAAEFRLGSAAERRLPSFERPSGLAGIGPRGWLLAIGLHVTVAGFALISQPLREPEPWPAGALTVSLVYERPSTEVAAIAPDAPAPAAAPEAAAEPSPPEPVISQAPAPDPLPAQLPSEPEPPPQVNIAALPQAVAPQELPEAPEPVPAEPARVESAPEPEPPVAEVPRPRAKPARSADVSRPTVAPVPAPQASHSEAQSAALAGSGSAPSSQVAALPLVPPRPVGAATGNRKPIYPAAARRQGLQGLVVLRVIVSAQGTARDVAVLTSSGHPILDDAAAAAVRGWRFEPATRGGVPTSGSADVPVRFTLQD